MKTSDHGYAVLEHFEGLRLKAYPDPATGGEPWTIGIGHTGDVKEGDVISESYAFKLLEDDLRRFEQGVSRLVKTKINQGQFDALVLFAFNVGLGNLSTSTLLGLVNANQFAEAAKQFARWNKANGKVMKGLVRRRAAEAALFMGLGGAEAITKGVKAAE